MSHIPGSETQNFFQIWKHDPYSKFRKTRHFPGLETWDKFQVRDNRFIVMSLLIGFEAQNYFQVCKHKTSSRLRNTFFQKYKQSSIFRNIIFMQKKYRHWIRIFENFKHYQHINSYHGCHWASCYHTAEMGQNIFKYKTISATIWRLFASTKQRVF